MKQQPCGEQHKLRSTINQPQMFRSVISKHW